jgi:hypothetical protein
MDVFKKLVLFTVATIAAVFLIIWSLDAFGFRSPISTFLVNWLAMSWVAIAGQVVHFSFPLRYYDIEGFERAGQVYERLGIRLFKGLVRRGPLSHSDLQEDKMAKIICSLAAVIVLLFVGLSLTLVVMLTTIHSARANPSIIYVDQDAPGPTHDGLSWTTAFTNVQSTLAPADYGDEIWIAEGVYTPGGAGEREATFTLKSGVALSTVALPGRRRRAISASGRPTSPCSAATLTGTTSPTPMAWSPALPTSLATMPITW